MSSIVERFLSGSYRVIRSKGGVYVNGFFQDAGDETIIICGSLQPTNARALKLMEEGTRLKEYFNFYSDQPLLVINTRSLARADTVKIQDATSVSPVFETYKVMSTESWTGFGLTYFKSVLSREPEQ